MTEQGSIVTDETVNAVDTGGTESVDDAAALFMQNWEDAPEEPSEHSEDEHEEHRSEETDEDDSDPGHDPEVEDDQSEVDHEDTEESEPEDSPDEQEAIPDDAEVEIEVNGEKVRASIKELKRLYGQEKALTQKSQALAQQRKEAEAYGAALAAKFDHMMEKATARFAKYKDLDFLALSREMDPESFKELRQEAKAAYEDLQFIQTEADHFMRIVNESRQKELQVKAQEAIKEIKKAIPDWSNSLYDEIRTYAVANGSDPEFINTLTDPGIIVAVHKAMLYDKGKKVATTKKVKAPKKVIKPSAKSSETVKPVKKNAALDRLAKTGDVEDAVAAIMAGWSNN